MARKASPDVQFRNLDTAMSKLDPKDQLEWVYKFLMSVDGKSLVMGGCLDSLRFYIDDTFVEPIMFIVDGQNLPSSALIAMAEGATTVEEAIEQLRETGFEVKGIYEQV